MKNNSRKYHFALTGNGPITNRGCEAIALGTRCILQKEFDSCDFLLASFAKDRPDLLPPDMKPFELNFDRPRWSRPWFQYQFRKLCRLPDNRTEVFKAIKPRLAGFDALFSIGGDNYAIDYGYDIIDRLMGINDCAGGLGLPVIIWGASIGPFDQNPAFEKKIIDHLSRVSLIVVREPESFQYLNSHGIVQNVLLAPDPAFVLEPKEPTLPPEIAKLVSSQFIGLNLSPILSKYVTGGHPDKWRVKAVDILEGLLDDFEEHVLLIPHVTSITGDQRMDDFLFLESIHSRLPSDIASRVAVLPNWYNCQEIKWIISRAEVFIGARTHATIAAFSCAVPCITVAYSRKAWGINKLIFDHYDWLIPAQDISATILNERLKRLWLEKAEVRNQLAQNLANMRKAAIEAGMFVKRILNS